MSGRPPHDLTGEAPAHGPPDRFGELLRSFRRQAHLTQRELADRAGLSTGAIRDLEQGRTRSPRPDSIDAIAAVLALSSHDTGVLHGAAKTRRSPATTPATGALRINILGPLDVRYGDVPVHLNSDAQRALLVRLALAAGTTVSQDELVDLLWPRGVPANAGNLLQTRIARLRRLLAADELSIVGSRAGYRLEASTETLDLLAFRDLVAKAAGAAPRAGAAPEARPTVARRPRLRSTIARRRTLRSTVSRRPWRCGAASRTRRPSTRCTRRSRTSTPRPFTHSPRWPARSAYRSGP